MLSVVLANLQTFSVMREKDNPSITRTPGYTGSQFPQNTYNDVVEQKNHLTDIKNNSEMVLTIKTLSIDSVFPGGNSLNSFSAPKHAGFG